jgi:hypothetical protein
MDQARPTGKLLDWKPIGTRPVGRPRQRWQEDVMEDLRKLEVKNWKETAKERRTWRDLAEKAKTHKGLYCQMMIMMMMMIMFLPCYSQGRMIIRLLKRCNTSSFIDTVI